MSLLGAVASFERLMFVISRAFTVEVALDSLTSCQDAGRLLVRKASDGVLETKLTLVDVASSKRFTGPQSDQPRGVEVPRCSTSWKARAVRRSLVVLGQHVIG